MVEGNITRYSLPDDWPARVLAGPTPEELDTIIYRKVEQIGASHKCLPPQPDIAQLLAAVGIEKRGTMSGLAELSEEELGVLIDAADGDDIPLAAKAYDALRQIAALRQGHGMPSNLASFESQVLLKTRKRPPAKGTPSYANLRHVQICALAMALTELKWAGTKDGQKVRKPSSYALVFNALEKYRKNERHAAPKVKADMTKSVRGISLLVKGASSHNVRLVAVNGGYVAKTKRELPIIWMGLATGAPWP